jgi:hypothetical protein
MTEDIFDELEALINSQTFDWRPVAVKFLGNLMTGVTIGLGMSVGLALAG